MNTSELGIYAVKEGGQLALKYFYKRDELRISLKGPQDYVSEADRIVENTIKDIITEYFPDDGFIGEEDGQRLGARQWVIDPIDGTTNFLRGIPYFCTTLALVEEEMVVAGWIYDPVHNHLYTARISEGAFENEERLQPIWRETLSSALVGICHSSKLTARELAGRMTSALDRGSILRQPGAGALMLCDLACGRLDVVFDQHLKPWDSLAGLLIAHEAGATVGDYLYSESWRDEVQPTLACGPRIYKEICEIWPEVKEVNLLKSNR